MQPAALNVVLAEVLDLRGAERDSLHVEPLAAGGNNRVYAVAAGRRKFVAKVYFRHPSDRRDRLHAEYAFLTSAARAGIRCVPRPVACDRVHGVGVYEFIEGRKLTAAGIDAACIDEAAEFILRLNHPSAREAARDLSDASEACFSIAGHFTTVDGRIDRLAGIDTVDALDREAREFTAALDARWREAKAAILRGARAARIDPEDERVERCVSPSDFGFHNALSTADRGICFLDFEYAGWDDPAKLVGDFFSHPAVPVDAVWHDRFLDAVAGYAADPAAITMRARLLLPIFQVKWCCIILNEFLPDAARRRRFADPNLDTGTRKREQLAKAVALFERIVV